MRRRRVTTTTTTTTKSSDEIHKENVVWNEDEKKDAPKECDSFSHPDGPHFPFELLDEKEGAEKMTEQSPKKGQITFHEAQ